MDTPGGGGEEAGEALQAPAFTRVRSLFPSFVHSFHHSCILTRIPSFFPAFVHSFHRSFILTRVRSFFPSLVHSYPRSFILPLARSFFLARGGGRCKAAFTQVIRPCVRVQWDRSAAGLGSGSGPVLGGWRGGRRASLQDFEKRGPSLKIALGENPPGGPPGHP